MSGYRDDHKAALDRAAALESELGGLRQAHDSDRQRIAALEAQLAASRAHVARMAAYGPEASLLPSSANQVLVMGILGISLCQILGPVAWSMANQELRRIDAGEADPTRRGTVQAGRVLGIVSTVLLGLSVLWMLVVLLAGAS